MILTEKEMTLLKDMKSQEQLCVEKYAKHSQAACDEQLKSLFNEIGKHEQTHLDTINQIMSGVVPSVSGATKKGQPGVTTPTYSLGDASECKTNDKYLCSDALAIEKHAATVYNTDIFEFKETSVRDVLNHIQTEEQHHGEQIYKYMEKNGMYN